MSERLTFNPEQEKAYGQIAGFFGQAEREFPAAAGRLANVVADWIYHQEVTPKQDRNEMERIDVGLALLGDWLKGVGSEWFEVKLGFVDGAKKTIDRRKMKFPSALDLIRVEGRVDPELTDQIPPLLSLFSRQIRAGLDVGLSPRQIVGGLVAESVGSRLSANGSRILRGALGQPVGWRFDWIREALGIADVAIQPGFAGKETLSATAVKRDKPTGKKEITPAKKELPAFLTGDELPEGYATVNLRPGEKQVIQLGLEPGSEAVVYVGNVGARLKRSADGRAFFSLLGFDLPKNIYPNSDNDVILENIGPHGIPLAEHGFKIFLSTSTVSSNTSVQGKGYWRSIALDLPGAMEKLGFGFFGPVFRVEEEGIAVKNDSTTNNLKISAPATVVRAGGAEAAAVSEQRTFIEEEVLSLKTRADLMMMAFFADPQRRGPNWGDIVDRSNRVDLDDFISYRRNLVPENWQDENQRQITDGLIQRIDALVNVGARARHHTYLTMFAQDYANASLEIRKTRKKESLTAVNEFKLGYFLTGVQTGVPVAMKHSLFFACVASEYGNLALSETDTYRRNIFLQRARFFHQAGLFEGKSSGDPVFSGDESRGSTPPAGREKIASLSRREAGKRVELEEAAQAETVLTSREKELIGVLGTAAALEADEFELRSLARAWGFADGEKYLQSLFQDTQFSFRALPAGSRMRAEVMKNVIVQLGVEGEKLRKSGKTDREIFDEWLRQVFLALYQRAGKRK